MDSAAGRRRTESPFEDLPPGVSWVSRLDGVPFNSAIAWSCDGRWLGSYGVRGCRIWPIDTTSDVHRPGLAIGDDGKGRRALDWSPTDPDFLVQVDSDRVIGWRVGDDGVSATPTWAIEATTAYSLSFAPDGESLALVGGDGMLRLYSTEDGSPVSARPLKFVSKAMNWSPTGNHIHAYRFMGPGVLISTGGAERELIELDKPDIRTTTGEWSPDGSYLAAGDNDRTIKIWNSDGVLQAVLEGHDDIILSLTFSRDGRLMYSLAADDTTRCWRTDNWNCVAVLRLRAGLNPNGNWTTQGLAHSPARGVLAWRSNFGDFVDLLTVDPERLLAAASSSRTYANAKVLLVGDTGVGKSGLGLVLSGEAYRATDSTHARKVFTFDEREVELPDGTERREILLWDLAGQPGYRLIHQLHLAEAAAALIVFDARSEADPFGAVRYWMRALRQCRANLPGSPATPAILVAARVDRGGIPVSRERVEALRAELGMIGYYETSAREGWNVDELAEAVRASINWDELPRSISSELFETIKRFLIEEKDSDRVLASAGDLFRDFGRQHPSLAADTGLRASFDTCIRLLEGADLVRRFSFGEFVLLRPELLDAHASALIDAARGQPDGLGYLSWEDAIAGRFRRPEEGRLTGSDEELLLIATVEELLRHDLALREMTDGSVDLIFPSQFTNEREAPADTKADVILRFEGSVSTVYATLAVRLSHVAAYQRDEMWRNASTYRAKVGGVCGLRVREPEDGLGELTVFFDDATSEETRFTFEDYVQAHVTAHALPGTVQRERVFTCPGCSYRLDAELVRRKLSRAAESMICPDCEQERILLLDREDRLGQQARQSVEQMNESADQGRDRAAATATIRGKETTSDYDVFLSFNSADRPAVSGIAEGLRVAGLLPWVDAHALVGGDEWQAELAAQIRRVRTAVVILGRHGLGRWQRLETEAIVDEHTRRPSLTVIPVLLAGTPADLELPPFVGRWHAVDFREAWPPPFERLVQAITGRPRQ
ncbi:TIR domain-containing protein [Paractinoplanes durhamensis]|uniref:TIR domain-containing protein n=1 Tax=Paractinoplanes durhamensis TaxID=113563 RepID=A0ABQ3YSF5_9ACTN|nr:TIR domain-containing protein [Actinoplanes durhamensis]GIE00444.1 hypothetical protein Adu01nite_17940 [Actinoplanes durhamensis]